MNILKRIFGNSQTNFKEENKMAIFKGLLSAFPAIVSEKEGQQPRILWNQIIFGIRAAWICPSPPAFRCRSDTSAPDGT